MLLDTVRDLTPGFIARDAAAPDAYPQQNVRDLQAAGVLLAPFPVALGGRGAPLTDTVRIVEIVAAASPQTALLLTMPLGLAGVFGAGGRVVPEPQRAFWTAQVAAVADEYKAGTIYAACNSERGAGGSLSATKAAVTRDAGGLRISGEKILASFGANADVFFSTARVAPDDLPGAGEVEFFLVDTHAPGVNIGADWNGFGMRGTESHTVRYEQAPVRDVAGFPGFIGTVQPLTYWFCLFAAIPLGCAWAMLDALGTPAPAGPALRLRLAEAQMRLESLRAYLSETAAAWRVAAGPAYGARVNRTKAFVSQEATRVCADLFALSGGRHYRRGDRVAGLLADAFAGTALRPPLPLALDMLVEQFDLQS